MSETRLQAGMEPGIEISSPRGLPMMRGMMRSAVPMAELDASLGGDDEQRVERQRSMGATLAGCGEK
jgi:hypothetical protein